MSSNCEFRDNQRDQCRKYPDIRFHNERMEIGYERVSVTDHPAAVAALKNRLRDNLHRSEPRRHSPAVPLSSGA